MADGDVTLKAVFPEWEREITFLDFQELLHGLESLIWTSLHSSVEHENERMHLKLVNRVVADQVIRRIRYNSPLEVVFTISASTGALAGAGFALLRLWDKFQESRVKTAEAGTVVSAYGQVPWSGVTADPSVFFQKGCSGVVGS